MINTARAEIAKNNAQIRYKGEMNRIEGDEQGRQNLDTIVKMTSDIAQTAIKQSETNNVNRFQTELNAAIMRGDFEYKGMDSSQGTVTDWADYRKNIDDFTNKWLEENCKYSPFSQQAVKNYVNNSETDIANTWQVQNWQKRVTAINSTSNQLLSQKFDDSENASDLKALIAMIGVNDPSITSETDLSKIDKFGISELYNAMEGEKAKMATDPTSCDYYKASTKLRMALWAYAENWTEEELTKKLSDEEAWRGYDIIQSACMIDESALVTAWKESGGSEAGMNEYIEKNQVGNTLQAQNGTTLSTVGYLSSAQGWRKSTISNEWSKISVQQQNLYKEGFDAIQQAELQGKVFYDSDGELEYLKSLDEDKYNGLYIETIKASETAERANKLQNNGYIRDIVKAGLIYAYEPSLESPATLDSKKEANATLARFNRSRTVSLMFDLGVIDDVSDNGKINNDYTKQVFEYMAKNYPDLSAVKPNGLFNEEYADKYVEGMFATNQIDKWFGNGATGSSKTQGATGFSSYAGADEDWKYSKGSYMDSNVSKYSKVLDNLEAISDDSGKGWESIESALKESGYKADNMDGSDSEMIAALRTSYDWCVANNVVDEKGNIDKEILKTHFKFQLEAINPNNTDKEQKTAIEALNDLSGTAFYLNHKDYCEMGYMVRNMGNGEDAKFDPAVARSYWMPSFVSDVESFVQKKDRDGLASYVENFGYKEEADSIRNSGEWKDISIAEILARLGNQNLSLSDIASDVMESAMEISGKVWDEGERFGLSGLKYRTSEGATEKIGDLIEKKISEDYFDMEQDWIMNYWQTEGDFLWGTKVNGITPKDEVKQMGEIGGKNYTLCAAGIAYARSENDRLLILQQAKRLLTKDAYTALSKANSVNLAVQGTGIEEFKTFELTEFLQSDPSFMDSKFANSLDNDKFKHFASYVGTNMGFLATCEAVTNAVKNNSMSVSDGWDKIADYIRGMTADYMYQNDPNKVSSDDVSWADKNGVDFYYYGTLDDINDALEYEANGGDVDQSDIDLGTATDYITKMGKYADDYWEFESANASFDTVTIVDNIFNPTKKNSTTEANANLVNLLGEVVDNPKNFNKNSQTLLEMVIAYNAVNVNERPIKVTKEDLTKKDNVNSLIKQITFLNSQMSNVGQYKFKSVYGQFHGTFKEKALYDSYGFSDTITYENGSFSSEKMGDLQINGNSKIISGKINGKTVGDVSVYSDRATTKDIAKSLFTVAESSISKHTNKGTYVLKSDFSQKGGATTVRKYNEDRAYLNAGNQEYKEDSPNTLVFVAHDSNYTYRDGSFKDLRVGRSRAGVPNMYPIGYMQCEHLTLNAVKEMYEGMVEKGDTVAASILLSGLTKKQAEYVNPNLKGSNSLKKVEKVGRQVK